MKRPAEAGERAMATSGVALILPSLEHRLVEFYQHHNPEKIPIDADVLSFYATRESVIAQHLEKKYPGSGGIAVRPVPRGFAAFDIVLQRPAAGGGFGMVVAHEVRDGLSDLAVVDGVMTGSPADVKGVRKGDTIAAINGLYISGPGFDHARYRGAVAAGKRCIRVEEALERLADRQDRLRLWVLRKLAKEKRPSVARRMSHPRLPGTSDGDSAGAALGLAGDGDGGEGAGAGAGAGARGDGGDDDGDGIGTLASFGLFDTCTGSRWLTPLGPTDAVLPHVATWSPEDVESGRHLLFKRWAFDAACGAERRAREARGTDQPELGFAYADARFHVAHSLHVLSVERVAVLAALQVVAESSGRKLAKARRGFYPPMQTLVPPALLQRADVTVEDVVERIVGALRELLSSLDGLLPADGEPVSPASPMPAGWGGGGQADECGGQAGECGGEGGDGGASDNGKSVQTPLKERQRVLDEARRVDARQRYIEQLQALPTYGCVFFPASELGGQSLCGQQMELMVAVGLSGVHIVCGENLSEVHTLLLADIVPRAEVTGRK
eukprot:g4702.t1